LHTVLASYPQPLLLLLYYSIKKIVVEEEERGTVTTTIFFKIGKRERGLRKETTDKVSDGFCKPPQYEQGCPYKAAGYELTPVPIPTAFIPHFTPFLRRPMPQRRNSATALRYKGQLHRATLQNCYDSF